MTLTEIKALEEKAAQMLAACRPSSQVTVEMVTADKIAEQRDAAKLSAWPAVVALLEEARELLRDGCCADGGPGTIYRWDYRRDDLLACIDGNLSK